MSSNFFPDSVRPAAPGHPFYQGTAGINPSVERLITLSEAAALFPTTSKGKKPHISALYRYTTVGLHGVVLDSVQAGSKRCTSREAVYRFFAALTSRQRLTPVIDGSAHREAEAAGQRLAATVFANRRQRKEVSDDQRVV